MWVTSAKNLGALRGSCSGVPRRSLGLQQLCIGPLEISAFVASLPTDELKSRGRTVKLPRKPTVVGGAKSRQHETYSPVAALRAEVHQPAAPLAARANSACHPGSSGVFPLWLWQAWPCVAKVASSPIRAPIAQADRREGD